jgi:D-3-phosphoglycerate dehydrogenase
MTASRARRYQGHPVDAEFGKSMIYVTNEDKPGFIGKFASLLGDAKRQHRDLPSRPRQGGDARRRRDRRWLSKVQALPQVKQAKALTF